MVTDEWITQALQEYDEIEWDSIETTEKIERIIWEIQDEFGLSYFQAYQLAYSYIHQVCIDDIDWVWLMDECNEWDRGDYDYQCVKEGCEYWD